MKSSVKILIVVFGLLTAAAAGAVQLDLDMSLSNPWLQAEERQTAYIRIGLTGFELESHGDRPPSNVSIVLDKSGSMSGDK